MPKIILNIAKNFSLVQWSKKVMVTDINSYIMAKNNSQGLSQLLLDNVFLIRIFNINLCNFIS